MIKMTLWPFRRSSGGGCGRVVARLPRGTARVEAAGERGSTSTATSRRPVEEREAFPSSSCLEVSSAGRWVASGRARLPLVRVGFFRAAGGAVPPESSSRCGRSTAIRAEGCWWYVRRVPDTWDPEALPPRAGLDHVRVSRGSAAT